jgi:hypothetical protein
MVLVLVQQDGLELSVTLVQLVIMVRVVLSALLVCMAVAIRGLLGMEPVRVIQDGMVLFVIHVLQITTA